MEQGAGVVTDRLQLAVKAEERLLLEDFRHSKPGENSSGLEVCKKTGA